MPPVALKLASSSLCLSLLFQGPLLCFRRASTTTAIPSCPSRTITRSSPSMRSHQSPPVLNPAPPAAQNNPPWVDEFLDFSAARRESYRRSASDSITFLEAPQLLEYCRNASALGSGANGGSGHNHHGFDRFDDEQFMSMFTDEIYEVTATRTKIYLVMELASGGKPFSKIFRRGRLTEPVARRHFQQLVSALHFCHLSDVVHRNVKPQNLLLDAAGALKVSDFGLSALPEQLRDGLLHTACGTQAYTAPEVVCRRGYDDSKADAWSCGVICFVLLACCMPLHDHNHVAVYKGIHARDYIFPDWISKPARCIIHQLLNRGLGDGPQSFGF